MAVDVVPCLSPSPPPGGGGGIDRGGIRALSFRAFFPSSKGGGQPYPNFKAKGRGFRGDGDYAAQIPWNRVCLEKG